MLRCRIRPDKKGIELTGAVTERTISQLERFLAKLEKGKVVLDLSGLTELDEKAMRPILLTSRRLRRTGGDLILANARADIRSFLEKEGFNLVLNVQ